MLVRFHCWRQILIESNNDKIIEYTHYNNEPPTSQQTYRGTPASHQVLTQEKSPKRGNTVYVQNSYSTPQDIYQSSVIQGYDDNHYSQVSSQH